MLIVLSTNSDIGTCTFFLDDPACVKLILGVPFSNDYSAMLDSLIGEDRVIMLDGVTNASDHCQTLFNFEAISFQDVFKDARPARRIPIHDPETVSQIRS